MKGEAKRRHSEIRKICPGTNCCDKLKSWIFRNIIHFILVMSAVAAIIGAILGSLDSCNTDLNIRNVTTTTNITTVVNVTKTVNKTRTVNVTVPVNTTTVTPLAVAYLIDGSGSMCLTSNFVGCTTGTCPSGAGNCIGPPCSCTDDKWAAAKANLPILNNILYERMNEGTNGTDKYEAGLIQWSDADSGTKIESALTMGNASVNTASSQMTLRTGSTRWGMGLCQCYKMLEQDSVAGANKLCVLIADGDLIQGGDELGSGACQSPGGRGANGPCDCDYLWTDAAAATDFTSTSANTDNTYVEEFVKYKNISILSVLVGTASITEIFAAASCDGISESNADSCDYFFNIADFDTLQSKATEIATKQRTRSTSVVTRESVVQEQEQEQVEETQTQESVETQQEIETQQSSVSVCSLDFLWALLAFGPFLAYLIYRIIDIKAKSKRLRSQLVAMIKSDAMNKRDISRYAVIATNLLLPHNFPSDIDWIIAYLLFQMPCMLPASKGDLEALCSQTTIAL